MPKLIRCFLLCCALVASVCLLTTLAAYCAVGPMPGFVAWDIRFGGNYPLRIGTYEMGTLLNYGPYNVVAPISRWSLTLISLIIPALACLLVAGILAWPVIKVRGGKTPARIAAYN